MKKIKWKPFPSFREDGTYYMVGDTLLNKGGDGAVVLKKISAMPPKKPISLQVGYNILVEHIYTMFTQPEGGRRLGHFLNEHGFFPEALTHLGYHIEVKEEDFVILDK